MKPHDWEKRMSTYLAEGEARPFSWGYHDCVLFAAGWLRALGYPDPLAPFDAWASPLSAARTIRAAGGFGPAVAERMATLGCRVIPPLTAQRGDVVLLQMDARRQALGVVVGTHAAAPGIYSLQSFPLLNRAVSAWRT
jgi:hypothetical protein